MDPAKPGGPLEYDEHGVPYYKWPPFPEPAPGVNIMPFRKFKPSGIQIGVMGDEAEIDGEGIPTVQLNVKHDLEQKPRKKPRTKKNITGQEVVKRYVWWEEWAAGEDLRSSFHYNMMLPRSDRLSLAADDFKKCREWPPHASRVQEWFDKFRLFIGLIGSNMRPIYKRYEDEAVEPYDEDSDDGEPSGNKEPQSQTAAKITIEDYDEKQHMIDDPVFTETDEQFRKRIEKQLEAKERRMEAFLNDPELAVKIFFSSYFRDSGMMWANAALRDAPLVVSFFLNFLLRNGALRESERALRAAIKINEKAKTELPQTKKIGAAIPDEFASCCEVLFGSRLRKVVWPTRSAPDLETGNEPKAKKAKLDTVQEDEEDGEVEFKAALKAAGAELISESVIPSIPATAGSSSDNLGSTNWNYKVGDEAWGAWGAEPSIIAAEPAGLGVDGMDENPWAQPAANFGWQAPVHSLMKLMGPTTFPLTYTVGYVEESTRHIVGWTPPEPRTKDKAEELKAGSDSDLRHTFAQVVLAPYKAFSVAERSAIQKPEILEDPLTNKEGEGMNEGSSLIPRHDPLIDNITLFIDPKATEHMTKGMGIGGTFVQAVPRPESIMGSPTEGKDSGRGRGGGRAGSRPEPEKPFWYAEKVVQVIPSFWIERQSA